MSDRRKECRRASSGRLRSRLAWLHKHAVAAASLLALFLMPALVRADGGVVRVSETAGSFRVTVFTSPTPPRAGVVDVSVLVQDASGKRVPDACVVVHVRPIGQTAGGTIHAATREAATNKLYQAAAIELPAGSWHLSVEALNEIGTGAVGFDMEVAEPLPAWTEMAFWIALPLVPVILFVLVQGSVRRRGTPRAD